MRILIVSPCFPPHPAVSSLRIHSFARAWSQSGCDVTVLTTYKHADERILDMPVDGFEVVELKYRIPRMLRAVRRQHKGASASGRGTRGSPLSPVNLLRRLRSSRGIYSAVRMPDLTDYWMKPAVQWARANGPWDVVVSSSGPYTAHLAALQIKRMGQAAFWAADFRDLWTQNHLFPGLFPFTIRERQLEKRCLREVDVVTTVSDGLAEQLRRGSNAAVEVIYNGYDENVEQPSTAVSAFANDGITRIVYTGTLYPKGQHPEPLLQALGELRDAGDDRYRLIAAGDGAEHWRAIVQRFDVENMTEVHGRMPREQALRMQRDADALLLLDWHRPDQGVLTGKVFEYLRCEAPILVVGGTKGSPLAKLVTNAGRGVYLGADVQAIRRTLEHIQRGGPVLDVPRNDGFIESFSRYRQAQRFLELLKQA